MKSEKPNKTESAFVSNKEVKRLAGKTDYKQNVKNVSVQLYDVDYAVKWHIESIINPTVVEENSIITVPIIYQTLRRLLDIQTLSVQLMMQIQAFCQTIRMYLPYMQSILRSM